MKLLLIEDEDGIGRFVCQGLRESSHTIDWSRDGREGLQFALNAYYDLIILDIMLPHLDGLQIIEELRQRGVKTPILCLTARDTVEERVRGLNTGADDYLVKPFEFSELLARIHALMRRPPLQILNTLKVADLELDLTRREFKCAGRVIDLSQREFMLLEYLMRNAGIVLTRTQIGEQVWGFDFYSETNVIDVYIGYLRRKIDRDKDANKSLIKTVRGVGFRLSDAQDPE